MIERDSLARAGYWLAPLPVVGFLAAALAYLLYPGYVDHGEASISAMAWLMLHGHAIYLPFDSPDQITNLYGPLTYLWHAWPLPLFGGSVWSSKLAAAISAVLILPGIWAISRHHRDMAGWIVTLAASILIIELAYPVVIRPDSMLTVMAIVATLAASRETNGWARSVVIGLAAGAAIGFKIHGAIYLGPIAVYYIVHDWRRAPVMAVAAIAVAMLPFTFPHQFPLDNYLAWFGPMAAKENNWLFELGKQGQVIALTAAPLAVWGLAGRAAWARAALAERLYLTAYALTMVVAAFPATKVGGGPHYFLPLLPAGADLIRRGLTAAGPMRRQRLGLAALALMALGTTWQCERRFFKKLEWGKAAAVVREIDQIIDAHPGASIQMGVGRMPNDVGAQFSYYYYTWRNLPVYRGGPYTVDAGIVMELQELGRPFPLEAIRRLATCDTELWLVPAGSQPFDLLGYYDMQVFPREFRSVFLTNYRKAESRQFFDVWECDHER